MFPLMLLKVQASVPEQSPPQPVKTKPMPGEAVRVMSSPSLKAAEQVPLMLAQLLMPLGDEFTVPPAVGVTVTVRAATKCATTLTGVVPVVTEPLQLMGLVPLQAPVHLSKKLPMLAAAERLND